MVITRDRLSDLTSRMNQSKLSTYRNYRRVDRKTSRVSASEPDNSRLAISNRDEVDYAVGYNEDDWPMDNSDHEGEDENHITNRSRLMSEAAWMAVEKFLNVASQLHQEIHLLESYVEDVKLKHSQLLVSPHEDKKTKDELDSVMGAFNQLSGKVRKTIKDMERDFDKIKLHRTTLLNTQSSSGQQQMIVDKSRADDRIRENQLAALNRRLLKVLRAYNDEQVRYKDFCTKRIKSYIDLTGEPIDEDELEEIIESGNLYRRMGGIFVDERKAKMMLEDIEARHSDIIRLEASVRELHQMFQDMALLVEEQGEKVDSIEFNVELAMEYTEKAKKQIKSAVAHRDRYRRKKIIVSIICAVIMIVLIIIIISTICSHVGCGVSNSPSGGQQSSVQSSTMAKSDGPSATTSLITE